MTYEQACVYLKEAEQYGSVLGLASIKKLTDYLGKPQDKLKFIHIAGTNGKGSLLAYLSSVLDMAGYMAGTFSSPALGCWRESIGINGDHINETSVAMHMESVAAATAQMVQEGHSHPTRFELEVALAFLHFVECRCDYVLLETGLGGATDATNIVTTTILEVITPISMDHMAILGESLSQIAEQKAGIIKRGTRVVSAKQQAEVADVIARVCRERNCSLTVVEPHRLSVLKTNLERQKFSYTSAAAGADDLEVQIELGGVYQIENAALAIEAVEALRALGLAISKEQLLLGLSAAKWPGRFMVIHDAPMVILDGAHNGAGAKALAESIEQYFPKRRILFLLGMFRDKDADAILANTAPLAAHIITLSMDENPRLMGAEELKRLVGKYHKSVEASQSIADAAGKAFDWAKEEDVIIGFGSLSHLETLRRELQLFV